MFFKCKKIKKNVWFVNQVKPRQKNTRIKLQISNSKLHMQYANCKHYAYIGQFILSLQFFFFRTAKRWTEKKIYECLNFVREMLWIGKAFVQQQNWERRKEARRKNQIISIIANDIIRLSIEHIVTTDTRWERDREG